MDTAEQAQSTAEHGRDKEVDLVVQTTRGTAAFKFRHNDKISDVIESVASHFGFGSSDAFSLVLASDTAHPLDPHRTLQSLHLLDGTVMILTATGTGV